MKTQFTDQEKADKILSVVADYYNITVEDMISESRKRVFVQPRQLSQKLIKENTKMISSQIGEITGKRDHATVLHACKIANNLLETDKDILNDFEKIKDILRFILSPKLDKAFLLGKLNLFRVIREAPNEEILLKRLLDELDVDIENTSQPKQLESDLKQANERIEKLKAQEHPAILQVKQLPEDQKTNVLTRIEAIVKMVTAKKRVYVP